MSTDPDYDDAALDLAYEAEFDRKARLQEMAEDMGYPDWQAYIEEENDRIKDQVPY